MRILTIIFFIKLILLSSCGYKIVNDMYDHNFAIKDLELTGNNDINKNLKKFFLKFEDKKDTDKFFDIKVDSDLIKKTTSKNSAGEDNSFSMKVLIKISILENNKIKNSSSFEKNISYNNLSSKFELKQYEKVLISDLTDQIILDINDYLSVIK